MKAMVKGFSGQNVLFVDVARPLRFPKAMFVLHYFFVDVDSWMMYRLRLRKKNGPV